MVFIQEKKILACNMYRALGGGILPNYDAVVFDECHTMENVAGEHLGLSISNSQIDYTLRKLFNPRTDKGILVALGLRQLAKDPTHAWSREMIFT